MPEYANIDEMVFEGRERLFGGYVLRKAYPWTLLLSTGLICGLFLIPTFGYLLGVRMGWIGDVEYITENYVINCFLLDPTYQDFDIGEIEVEFRVPIPSTKPDPPSGNNKEKETEGNIEPFELPEVNFLPEAPSFVCGEEVYSSDLELIEEVAPPIATICGFVNQLPIPINLEEVEALLSYPKPGKRRREEAVFIVKFLIDTRGNYLAHQISENANTIFVEEVEQHVHKLKFTPAIQGGRPIKFWVNVPFRFTLLE